ncbi:MAG: CDGSH iron-sulfur domain-containing protein [Fimbriimonadaceae bacterium]|nr:CDGSH iron-sulfur domain-containing protein [Alphaproteobacteria bacterium]
MTSKAVPAQKAPYKTVLEEGKNYAWCACGLSKAQPFCDGSHKDVGMKPVVFTADKSGDHWLCGCKATGKQPMCDGTHKNF